MKRNVYIVLLLLTVAIKGYGQGSQINGTTQVHPGGYYGVYGTLTFNSGYLVTPRNLPNSNVYFTAGSATAGQKDASHINGYAEKEGTTAFTFPIGDGTTLRTAGTSAPAASARFQAAYFSVNPNSATLPTGAPFPTANKAASVSAVSTVEYWDVNGSVSTNLTLSWNAASDLVTLTNNMLGNLIIVGYNPNTSQWEDLGAAAVSGTLSGTGTISTSIAAFAPNNYTAYTFGSLLSLPDLTPIIYARPSTVYGTTPMTVVVDVVELLNVPTSGLVTVRLTKDVKLSLSFNPTATTINGKSVQNSNWSFDASSNPSYYVLTTSQVIAAGNQLSFGLSGTLGPGATSGSLTVSAVVVDGSGTEVRVTNNVDADKIDYFQQ